MMRAYRFRLSLRQPIVLAGVAHQFREGVLIESDGMWGEASPLPGFSRESLDDVLRALRGDSDPPASLEFAFHSLGVAGEPFRVPIHELCLGDASGEDSRDANVSAVKLKVGRASVEEDIAKVRRVRASLRSEQKLLLDANRAWDFQSATDFAEALGECEITYIEEPLRDPSGLEPFYEQTGLPYALDETLATITDTSLQTQFPRAAALVYKPTILGVRRLRELCKVGKPIVFSSAFESGVGLAKIAELSRRISRDRPAGLDTYHLLESDVIFPRHHTANGMLEIADYVVTREALQEIDL